MTAIADITRMLGTTKGTLQAVPVASSDPDSLLTSVNALKEVVETFSGARGREGDRVITVRDLSLILELLVPFVIEEVRKEFHP